MVAEDATGVGAVPSVQHSPPEVPAEHAGGEDPAEIVEVVTNGSVVETVEPSSVIEESATVVVVPNFVILFCVPGPTVPEPPPGVVIWANAATNKKAPQSAERMRVRMDYSSIE
jgi:hypothetical protein